MSCYKLYQLIIICIIIYVVGTDNRNGWGLHVMSIGVAAFG